MEACYAAKLVQSFDWMRWTESNPSIAASTEFIGSADLRAIIALLTTHIRGDRFATGHLVLNSPKYLRICAECGERNAIGHMMSDHPGVNICQGCAQRNHGVVFQAGPGCPAPVNTCPILLNRRACTFVMKLYIDASVGRPHNSGITYSRGVK